MAGGEDVEAAVGEADGKALVVPAVDEVGGGLPGEQAGGAGEAGGSGGCGVLGGEFVQDFGDVGGGGAELADHDAGGGVGDVHGLHQGAAAGEGQGQGSDDGVAGAGDV